MHELKLKDWVDTGVDALSSGDVRIMDRRPVFVRDDLSPAGGYGWQKSQAWYHSDAMTLPDFIFEELPWDGDARFMPRWATEAEALAALDQAAWLWARKAADFPRGGLNRPLPQGP